MQIDNATDSATLKKSGMGLPHSKTWRLDFSFGRRASVLECGSPMPLCFRMAEAARIDSLISSKSKLKPSVRLDLCPSPFRSPALHVHRNRIARNMSPRGFDVHCKRRGVAAQTLRANPRLIDRRE